MDKQPSAAAVEAAKDLLAEGNFVRYMDGEILVNIQPLALAFDEQVRAALLEAKAIAIECMHDWYREYPGSKRVAGYIVGTGAGAIALKIQDLIDALMEPTEA